MSEAAEEESSHGTLPDETTSTAPVGPTAEEQSETDQQQPSEEPQEETEEKGEESIKEDDVEKIPQETAPVTNENNTTANDPNETSRSTPAFLTDSPAPGISGNGEQPEEVAPEPPTSTGKRKRLPQDVVGKLEDRISDNSSDIDAWRELIAEVKKKEKLDELREIYERMLKNFPTSAETWIDYIDCELANGEFYRVEQLFSRCLPKVLNIKLWTHYLGYVRRINNVNSADGEKARNVISQVFEFVFERMGIDRNSGPLWSQYIDFIRSKEPTTTWEQQQQMDLLRKTYRRAICIPLVNLEDLWHSYNTFETNLNKTTARKFIAEKSGAYMTARSAVREMQNMIGGQDITNSTPYPRRWTKKEDKEAKQWFRWLEWEKKNPLDTDAETVKSRVIFAYKQAVMVMRYFPDIWFDAVEYLLSIEQTSTAAEFLKQGTHANPTSFILFYKRAEVEERDMKTKEMKETFTKLLENLKAHRTKLEQQQAEISEEDTHNSKKELSKVDEKIETNAKDITAVYSVYMKAVKRAEGIKEARRIFSEGRKLVYTTHHIYVASALMEFYNDKSAGIAGKIFEIGLKRYSDVPEYVQEYFNFLILTNDDANARALFEKSVVKMSLEAARPLYERFLEYEANYGELSALLKLEKRFKENYPDENSVSVFADRYKLLGLDPVREVDLGERFRQSNKQNPPKKGNTTQDENNSNSNNNYSNSPAPVNENDDDDDDDDDDTRPTKRVKEENGGDEYNSPTVEQAAQNALPSGIMNLLKVLPPAPTYDTVTFDASKLVKLIKETPIPDELLGN